MKYSRTEREKSLYIIFSILYIFIKSLKNNKIQPTQKQSTHQMDLYKTHQKVWFYCLEMYFYVMNIGIGTAAIGRPHYINIKTKSSKSDAFNREQFIQEGIKILSVAYQNGIRNFDTAPGYGIAEEIILKWLELEKPKGISISTKWGYTYVANFDINAPQHEIKEHSLAKLNEQWKYSSQLLPFLNIYQIHSATLDSGVLDNQEVLNRLFELKREHGIEIGLSASGENQNKIIEKALSVKINDELLFDSFQITYNIFDQSASILKEKLKQFNRKIIVKEALANGRIFPNDKYPEYKNAYQHLSQLSEKYEVGVDAIALRFCLDTLQPYSVLSGASEEEHLISNLKANTFKLLPSEIKTLQSFAVKPLLYWKERKLLVWN